MNLWFKKYLNEVDSSIMNLWFKKYLNEVDSTIMNLWFKKYLNEVDSIIIGTNLWFIPQISEHWPKKIPGQVF